MAKYCSSCGTALEAKARFCPACGARVPEEAPAPVVIDAPKGSTVVISDAPPARVGAPGAGGGASRPVRAKGSSAPGAGKGRRFLSLLLALIMVIELGVAGFKYPGFLRKSGGGPTVSRPTAAPLSPAPTASPAQHTDGGGNNGSGDDAEELFTENIRLRYRKDQLDEAPAYTTEVSSLEAPWAELGEVQVVLHAWNMEEETDKLTVKTLPELSAEDCCWSIRAYDFSLASGQREFPTDVQIAIPREEDELFCSCIWYNEAEDRWEDVYAELSEDGRYYLIYADHFSLFGKKNYRFDAKTYALVDDNGGVGVSVRDGVFVELLDDRVDDPMRWKVYIDWTRMWNLYQSKTAEDMAALSGKLESLFARGLETENSKARNAAYDIGQNFFSGVGAVDNANSVSGNLFYGLSETAGQTLAAILLFVDIELTTLKIVNEAKRGNPDAASYLKALPSAALNHKQELSGITLTIISMYTFGLTWITALIGLAWWGGSNIYNYLAEPYDWQVRQNPDLEQLYHGFYGPWGGGRSFDFSETGPRVHMTRPGGLDDETFGKLQQAVNPGGIDGFSGNIHGFENFAGNIDEEACLSTGWAKSFKVILEECGDDPELLAEVLDSFYYNYAYAFWNLTEKQKQAYAERMADYGSTPEEREARAKELVEMMEKPEWETRARLTEDWADQIKLYTRPVLLSVLKQKQRESCQELQKAIEKQLLPILNTRLIFHVEDTFLTGDQTFQDSVFCRNWRNIPGNERYAALGQGVRYDDKALITPMRFAGDPYPQFLPLLPRDVRTPEQPGSNKKEWYYPYTPDFLPTAPKSGDVVYTCTYYHYLMMGAPREMIFKDVSRPENYTDAQEVRGKIEIPALTGAERAVDVYIRVAPNTEEFNLELYLLEDSFYLDDGLHALWKTRHMARDNSFTMDEGGNVTIQLAALGFAGEQEKPEPDGSLTPLSSYESAFRITRPAMTFLGTVEKRQENSDGGFTLTGVLSSASAEFTVEKWTDYKYYLDDFRAYDDQQYMTRTEAARIIDNRVEFELTYVPSGDPSRPEGKVDIWLDFSENIESSEAYHFGVYWSDEEYRYKTESWEYTEDHSNRKNATIHLANHTEE